MARGGEHVDRELDVASAEENLRGVAGVSCGDVIAGKYRVEAVLGVGGMGVVVAARHVQLDDRVAIKVLRPQMATLEEAVVRFSQEARAAVRIKSEHAARVFDVGTLENGAPYLVMELLEGRDLGAWLATDGPLAVEQAVDFVLQACAAMADAHSLGIVHRDIKPANLFCCRRRDGQLWIKVLDFGISKVTDAVSLSRQGVTRSNTVLGTPEHMSPEQMRGGADVDARADIWAIGVTLYELLSGELPFSGEAFVDVANSVMTTAPPPLRTLRPGVAAGLEAAILTCLEKDRDHRFGNVADLAAAIVPFGSSRAQGWADECLAVLRTAGALTNRSVGSISEPPKPAHVGSLAPIGHTRGPGLADRKRLGVSAAVALAALGGFGLFRVLSGTRSAARLDAKPVAGDLAAAPSQTPALPADEADVATATLTFDSLAPLARPTSSPRIPKASGVWLRDAGAPEAGAQVRAPLVEPSSRTNCSPPYTIDSAGHRRYKPECP
jgi:serine/threonine-protein kinase